MRLHPKLTLLFLVFHFPIVSCNESKNMKCTEKGYTLSVADSYTSKSPQNQDSSSEARKTNKNENKIFDLIFALPEVKERANYIEKETNGQRHLRVLIYQIPEETEEKCYWVKAGEDNGINFVSHFNFFVDPNTFEIKYFDTLNDKIISLEEWRKQTQNDPK